VSKIDEGGLAMPKGLSLWERICLWVCDHGRCKGKGPEGCLLGRICIFCQVAKRLREREEEVGRREADRQ